MKSVFSDLGKEQRGAGDKWSKEGSVVLEPDLDHCIEVRARQAHADAARRLLVGEEAQDGLIRQAELLEDFLRYADFRLLRRESEPQLLAGRKVSFVIYRDGGAVKWIMRS
jgi:hypothetical protein